MLGVSCLNKLDAATKVTSNPQALSSALTVLGMLQLQAFGLLNRLVPLVLASNYYIGLQNSTHTRSIGINGELLSKGMISILTSQQAPLSEVKISIQYSLLILMIIPFDSITL